jgi:hypothetical protein
MANPGNRRLWRFIYFSAIPVLAVLAGLLLVRGDAVSTGLGVLLGLAAAAALLVPFMRRRG